MKKYELHRDEIKTGDILLFNGHGLISKIIQKVDNAYYNHTGVAYWIKGITEDFDRLFIIDAERDGVELLPMSRRMNAYDDFCIIRKKIIIKNVLNQSLSNLIQRVERDEAYGFMGLIKRAIYINTEKKHPKLHKFIKPILNSINKKNLPVCSDISKSFLVDLGCDFYESVVLPSPQDLIRYSNLKEVDILFNENGKNY